MSKIIKFETPSMTTSRFFRQNKSYFEETAAKMQKIIVDPEEHLETKLLSKMSKSIVEFDDIEFEKSHSLLNRLNNSNISVIKSK